MALTSTQAQLDSTKLGLQVGVRTNLDVLNAEQQVLSARRDLAGARYAYLLSGLSLKAAVGALSAADLKAIDKLLTGQRSSPVSSTPEVKTMPAPTPMTLKKDTLGSHSKPAKTDSR